MLPLRVAGRGRRGRELAVVARHWTGAATRWTYRLESAGEVTRVTESYRSVGTPRWILAIERLLRRDRRLERGMRVTLERIRRPAEAAPPGSEL